MRRAGYLLPAIIGVCFTLGAISGFLSRPLITGAVQNPRMSLDMDPSGNTYDPATNTMTVGSIDSCLASPEGNPATHTHTVQVVVQDVEDLIGWQARLNYNGDEMKPAGVNFTPFADTTTQQNISFVNLPKDAETGAHREMTDASAEHTNTFATGSAYLRTQRLDVSPDTPPKSPPDDTSYSAPSGGVLATLDLKVMGDQRGKTLFMQLDNDNPNGPGSGVSVFDGSQSQAVDLRESELNSGFHSEGAAGCSAVPTPRDLVADLRLADVAARAPAAVSPDQPFDIQVGVTVENKGPDETNARLTLLFLPPSGYCSGPEEEVYMGDVKVQPLGTASLEHSETFSCNQAQDTHSYTFHVVSYAYTDADDPDASNNAASGEIAVDVIGIGPAPTQDPTQPTPDPLDPNYPTPDPPVVVPMSGTSPPNGAPAVAGSVAVAQANIQTPASAVLAAALPQTGQTDGGGAPDWIQLVVAVVGVGVTVAVLLAMRSLITRRR